MPPPPWMKMTSGVGWSDLAFHRSKTLTFLSLPYTTLVMSGRVVEAGFFGGPLGTAFSALGLSSCAARRAVPRSAVISPMRSIRRYFICLSTHHLQTLDRSGAGAELVGFDAQPLQHAHVELAQGGVV